MPIRVSAGSGKSLKPPLKEEESEPSAAPHVEPTDDPLVDAFIRALNTLVPVLQELGQAEVANVRAEEQAHHSRRAFWDAATKGIGAIDGVASGLSKLPIMGLLQGVMGGVKIAE